MDWSKIELSAKLQTSQILKTKAAPIGPPIPSYEPRGFENIADSNRNLTLESHSILSKYSNLQGVVASHEELLQEYTNKTNDSNHRLQHIEASQRVINERLGEIQSWQERQIKSASAKSSEDAEALVTVRALLRRIESLEDTLRSSSQEVVTKPLFTQLVDTCMDQLSGLRSVTEMSEKRADEALYHVETTLQAIAQLKNSKFGFQLDYLKGLSRDAQRSQLSLLVRDAIDGSILRLLNERSEQADEGYRSEINALKIEQQRFQKEMMSRFRVLEASADDKTSQDARLEEVLVQVQRMQRKLDGEVKHTTAALAAMEADIQLKMETQLRTLGPTAQHLQKEVKGLDRRISENYEKVTAVDVLQEEMRRVIENHKTESVAEINKLRREIPNVDSHVKKLESSIRVLEESVHTIQAELATIDDLVVSVKAAGDTRVKAVQQLSDEVKTLKNEGCSLAKQCVSRLYILQSSDVPVMPTAQGATRLEKVSQSNIPAMPPLSAIQQPSAEGAVKKMVSPPSLATRVESLRRNVQSTIEKYEVTVPKPALTISVSDDDNDERPIREAGHGIVLSPQKNIAVGDIDESMSLSSDDESAESVCEAPTDSPVPTLSKSAAQAAAAQPLVMTVSPIRAPSSDGVKLSPNKNINPDDMDEAVSFQSSDSDDDGEVARPETASSPEVLQNLLTVQVSSPARAISPQVSENEASELLSFGDSVSKSTSNQLTHDGHIDVVEDLEDKNYNHEDENSCGSAMSSDSFESDDAQNKNITLPMVDSLGNLVMPQHRKPPQETSKLRSVDPPTVSGSLMDSNRASSRGKPPSHLSALPWIGGGASPALHDVEEVCTSPRPVSAPLPRSNTTGHMRPGSSNAPTAQCQHCLRRIVVQDMKAHQETCELRPLHCKFGCGAKVIALKMEKHLENCVNNPDNKCEEDDSFASK